jgi:tRNA U34 5-methylaminomethyl-2-thiouridine-forming methyltransferase MnmC
MKKGVDWSLYSRFNTPDGSYTLLLPSKAESYHSIYGARTESLFVFIQNGLQTLNKRQVVVCETGFGTGLNALLTLEFAQLNGLILHYHACELFPIPAEMLPPPKFLNKNVFLSNAWLNIHNCSWNRTHNITSFFTLAKMEQSVSEFCPIKKADVWFHDAFSPKTQPEMWSAELFSHIGKHLAEGGCLVTYSAAGRVKRALREAGFTVERLPGPPGKKHMLRAFRRN